ncbi:hypothetical protein [Phyllobacterium endophyticum]|uniref:hypothetical protein n=1 Tax=Phyllobacterium endophyticum TaxID=1149773 RepID=UPI0011C8154F|nr:hypothetical protein [Phyllobacterium endophyticum]TXR47257.1 hypothetical protein FVA77_21175 [Phyllobacterium endophyticum]
MAQVTNASGTGTLFDSDTETTVSYTIGDKGDALKERSPVGAITNIAPEILQQFKNASAVSLRLEDGQVLHISLVGPGADGTVKFTIHE